jgi:hypothetical protein
MNFNCSLPLIRQLDFKQAFDDATERAELRQNVKNVALYDEAALSNSLHQVFLIPSRETAFDGEKFAPKKKELSMTRLHIKRHRSARD